MAAAKPYDRILSASQKVSWPLADATTCSRSFDFSCDLLPESFARTRCLHFLAPDERRRLNHIRARSYLSMFELFERCILPYIVAHAACSTSADASRTPAFNQFAAEEAKHIELFRHWGQRFDEDSGLSCEAIGPAEDIGAVIRGHGALGVALFILAVEWATQRHYVESVRDDNTLDPTFKELLRLHWLEECQHAKLDALLFAELASGSSIEQIDAGIEDFLQICTFIDAGLRMQINLDLRSLEAVVGRAIPSGFRETLAMQQHQAIRWTFLGSALHNVHFLAAVSAVTQKGRRQIQQVMPTYC